MTAKTTFQAGSRGTAGLAETAINGQFIVVENKTQSALALGGWSLERSVDQGILMTYNFPAAFSLNALASVKIWADGASDKTAALGNLIWTGNASWGIGANATNELKNATGALEATLTQTTGLSN